MLTKAAMAKEENRGANVEELVDLWKQDMKLAKVTGNTSGIKSTQEIVNELLNDKLITEDEKDIILGNELKGIKAKYSITIASKLIDFYTSEYRNGVPGLYATKTNILLKSWNELIEEGYITVSDNIITSSQKNKIGDLVIAEGTTEIGNRAFYSDKNLTGLTLPRSLEKVCGYAFRECSKISEIRVFSSNFVTENEAFSVMGDLSIIYEEGVTNIVGLGCGRCTSVKIPSTATSIGASAFNGYTKLTEFTIPSTIKTIGSSAFYRCTGLTSITIPSTLETIGQYAFRYCSNLSEIRIQNSNLNINDVFSLGANEVSLIYEEGVTNLISVGLGSRCTSVKIPSTATSIGASAFNGYTKLTEFTIPSTIKTIGYSAFYGCTGLTSITIPSTLETIGLYAFRYCSNLSEIRIQNSNLNINEVFSLGANEVSLIYEEGVTNLISVGLGSRCTSVKIPNTVTTINQSAFNGYSKLTEINIPNSVISIGSQSFKNCSNLTQINIDKPKDTISNAPWGATNATVKWKE